MIGITGATGFVGMFHTVVLMKMGIPVRILVRKGYPFAQNAPKGVEVCVGDLRDNESLQRFTEGLKVCFHYAARATFKGTYDKFKQANIEGTRNIVEACRDVPRLIVASTQAVALENRDIVEQSEDHPYPKKFFDYYGETKAEVEQMVIRKHPGGTIIRPPYIWGVGDTKNLPMIIRPYLRKRLALIGGGNNLLDTVHIANFVHAAMLLAQNKMCRRQIYFVSDDQPIRSKDLINGHLEACGYTACNLIVPKFFANLLMMSDRLAGRIGSRSYVLYAFRTLTYNDSKLRQATGYRSIITREEGLKELGEWVQFIGGPEITLTGRRRGEAKQLVEGTWEYLMEHSVCLRKLMKIGETE